MSSVCLPPTQAFCSPPSPANQRRPGTLHYIASCFIALCCYSSVSLLHGLRCQLSAHVTPSSALLSLFYETNDWRPYAINDLPLGFYVADGGRTGSWKHREVHPSLKLSEVNKKNCAKQQLISTTGPKSIAKRQQDYVEIDNILASQTNDGSDNNANAKESEILSELLGKQHPGKPRCYGSFVSSTDVNHECDHVSNERSNEENNVFHSLNGRSSAGSLVFPSHNACYLLGFAYNRVAEGKILNKDPSKIVDGIPLGEDYYEVQLVEGIDQERLMKKKLLKSGDEEDVVEEWR
ncbi:hypothetical protein Taro_017805 [Colocasia esculenta]|uniref:Uncharacterized protein n=1 Tax=Colocasia esculenta TaxID=4460 RepID=A0A843UP35_COLES|nr:hypothetical protein [Colocasia esculenta]